MTRKSLTHQIKEPHGNMDILILTEDRQHSLNHTGLLVVDKSVIIHAASTAKTEATFEILVNG